MVVYDVEKMVDFVLSVNVTARILHSRSIHEAVLVNYNWLFYKIVL